MICDVCFSPMLLYPFHTSHTNLSITKIDKRSIKAKNMERYVAKNLTEYINAQLRRVIIKTCKTVKL